MTTRILSPRLALPTHRHVLLRLICGWGDGGSDWSDRTTACDSTLHGDGEWIFSVFIFFIFLATAAGGTCS